MVGIKKDAHITYIDENDQTTAGWFKITEINIGYISFNTPSNKITIPMSRLIKVKERGVESE